MRGPVGGAAAVVIGVGVADGLRAGDGDAGCGVGVFGGGELGGRVGGDDARGSGPEVAAAAAGGVAGLAVGDHDGAGAGEETGAAGGVVFVLLGNGWEILFDVGGMFGAGGVGAGEQVGGFVEDGFEAFVVEEPFDDAVDVEGEGFILVTKRVNLALEPLFVFAFRTVTFGVDGLQLIC